MNAITKALAWLFADSWRDCVPNSNEARLHQWRERRKAVALQANDGVQHDHNRHVQYLRGVRALTLWRHWWRIRPILAATWSNEQ